ncbi:hypothetical protein GOV08_00210, partial [Candidatus Woesearchaeota archaeon]|nr:hypothetical protein [Candidatus Woesearchaeota archaeon]
MKKLLELKKKIKAKTPKFKRTDVHKKPKLKKTGWRKPKGIHNKMRLNLRGYNKVVKKGYGTPKKVKGLDKDEKKTVVISSVKELGNVKKEDKILIASSIGSKKRLEIIDAATKQKVTIANYKDMHAYAKKLRESIKLKQKEQQSKIDGRQKKKQIAEKKKEKEEKKKIVDEKVDEESKKAEEK